MARVVKEYDERYADFLVVARRLFYEQGYEPTSVQSIIQAVGVAKGTFYHYFDSKADLLDAVTIQMARETLDQLAPMVADEQFSAIEKFNRLFAGIGSWKAANKAFFLDLARTLYQDENVLLLSKMQRASTAMVAPLLGDIIRQGVAEGVFTVGHPNETAEILFAMGQALSNAVGPLLLAGDSDEESIEGIVQRVIAYERGIERVLGAEEGTLHLFDLDELRAWFE